MFSIWVQGDYLVKIIFLWVLYCRQTVQFYLGGCFGFNSAVISMSVPSAAVVEGSCFWVHVMLSLPRARGLATGLILWDVHHSPKIKLAHNVMYGIVLQGKGRGSFIACIT